MDLGPSESSDVAASSNGASFCPAPMMSYSCVSLDASLTGNSARCSVETKRINEPVWPRLQLPADGRVLGGGAEALTEAACHVMMSSSHLCYTSLSLSLSLRNTCNGLTPPPSSCLTSASVSPSSCSELLSPCLYLACDSDHVGGA